MGFAQNVTSKQMKLKRLRQLVDSDDEGIPWFQHAGTLADAFSIAACTSAVIRVGLLWEKACTVLCVLAHDLSVASRNYWQRQLVYV